jgi:BMFP domain-containing protein YqiC
MVMRSRPGLISDLAQVANGAASALGGLREEIENIVSARTERALNARGLVTREEFDALRTRHEALAARLAAMEADMAAASAAPAKKTASVKLLERHAASVDSSAILPLVD